VVAGIFPDRKINFITNGVHSVTWTAPEFQLLYDKYLSGWRQENNLLKKAGVIPAGEIWSAHQQVKRRLLDYVNKELGLSWSENVLTIAFARRMVSYKRPGLLFFEVNRLLEAQAKAGKMQIIYAGKAHPQDETGQKLIKDLYEIKNKYAACLEICFLENYEAPLAKLLTAGADLWLNTPLLGNEASGTSGMKAAHNGVPQLSTLDGWWEEGYVAEQTGWLITEGKENKEQAINRAEADSLYKILEQEILPAYYHDQEKWRLMMRSTISLNASRFSAERVVAQYAAAVYGLKKKT
jgi:starch phosphorylase